MAEKYDVEIPGGNSWSWNDLTTFAAKITQPSGGKVYGTGIEPVTLANLIAYSGQAGEDFFTAAGHLGVTAKTIASCSA